MEENRQYDQEYKIQAVRLAKEIGLSHHPKRKRNRITKSDREAHKSDELLKWDFQATKPFTKCVTDITYVQKVSESPISKIVLQVL